MTTAVVTSRYRSDLNLRLFEARLAGKLAGSVAVREHCDRIAIGQLATVTGFRGRGVARALMEHVLRLYPGAEAWLYADPYVPEGERPGLPRAVLKRFYASLGFAEAREHPDPRLMMRPAGLTVPARSR